MIELCIHLYADDVDTRSAEAIAIRGKKLEPVADQFFYGNRTGTLKDPFDHIACRHTYKVSRLNMPIAGCGDV